jgi:hypothetical protein
MKYFAPSWKLREWISKGTLRPNLIDQPMAKFIDGGHELTAAEQERAFFLLTNADMVFKEFRKLPEVISAIGPKSGLE